MHHVAPLHRRPHRAGAGPHVRAGGLGGQRKVLAAAGGAARQRVVEAEAAGQAQGCSGHRGAAATPAPPGAAPSRPAAAPRLQGRPCERGRSAARHQGPAGGGSMLVAVLLRVYFSLLACAVAWVACGACRRGGPSSAALGSARTDGWLARPHHPRPSARPRPALHRAWAAGLAWFASAPSGLCGPCPQSSPLTQTR